MCPNTWYYTLSTISQTLAAILALAAVFAILRLESLRKNIGDYKGRALKILSAKEKHLNSGKKSWDTIKIILEDLREFNQNYATKYDKNLSIQQDLTKLSANYEPLIQTSNADFVADTIKNLDSFVSQRDGVVKLVKWPGIVTSLAIAVPILLLSLSDRAISHSLVLLLLFVVALALFGLWSVIRACWKIILAVKTLE